MQGIFLIEDPISLYRCEKARLYLGFSLRVTIKDPDNNIDDADQVSTSLQKTCCRTNRNLCLSICSSRIRNI